MAHNNHIIDGINKDLLGEYKSREQYLELTKDFKSLLPKPIIEKHEGITIVNDSKLYGGSKLRAGEFLISKTNKDTLVYCVPRVGLAGIAILELCKLYNKEVIFFMPSSKEVSDHQAAIIQSGPKDVIFKRIAAMPNLNLEAKKFAKDNGYEFLPFGLNHPYTIAGFVRTCEEILKEHNEPKELWSAVSTGVLTRGIQIGFPNTIMNGVCVARNMKYGELGRTNVISEELPFLKNEKDVNLPPFSSMKSYDAKVWKYIPKNTDKDIWFWNVGSDINKPSIDKSKINSYRDWIKNLI